MGAALLLSAFAPVAVLAPLGYGPGCWSVVELQNLAAGPARIAVEGHKGSGALVGLGGARGVSLTLGPGETRTLRLEVPGEESREGWVKVTETGATPMVAVSGRTECVAWELLETVPQTVAFPVPDPWLQTAIADVRGRTAMVLNTGADAATANVCYSRGSMVGVPGDGGELSRVCTETARLQIPPYGTRMVPLEKGGNTEFHLGTRGAAVVLRVLLPAAGTKRQFQVDSSIRFGEPLR